MCHRPTSRCLWLTLILRSAPHSHVSYIVIQPCADGLWRTGNGTGPANPRSRCRSRIGRCRCFIVSVQRVGYVAFGIPAGTAVSAHATLARSRARRTMRHDARRADAETLGQIVRRRSVDHGGGQADRKVIGLLAPSQCLTHERHLASRKPELDVQQVAADMQRKYPDFSFWPMRSTMSRTHVLLVRHSSRRWSSAGRTFLNRYRPFLAKQWEHTLP